ncbi:unnamed protein product [Polarella glacialis]|uniref:Uncharacterized protein n=1 Tax=Polarella glacialis TaxID=89957 RepID=A0A813JZM2_POLGL|nr:unnamed protein product [Polarella glacialis]
MLLLDTPENLIAGNAFSGPMLADTGHRSTDRSVSGCFLRTYLMVSRVCRLFLRLPVQVGFRWHQHYLATLRIMTVSSTRSDLSHDCSVSKTALIFRVAPPGISVLCDRFQLKTSLKLKLRATSRNFQAASLA